MQIGCGLTEKVIKGHRYLYFWKYEERGNGTDQVYKYVGRADDPEARTTAMREVEKYSSEARRMIDEAVARMRAKLMGSVLRS